MPLDDHSPVGPETALLHFDRQRDGTHGAVHTPIFLSVPYGHPDTASLIAVFQQRKPGFTYARQTNPTNAVLEAKISYLEEAKDSIVFSTGMGAISALFLALLQQGDHVLCSRHVFGNTSSLLATFGRFGVSVDFVDATSAANVRDMLRPETRFIFIETIANPGTEISDIEGIGALCSEHGVLLVVDNTITTPAILRPARYGAGLVINSLTKGVGGHGHAMGGAISDTGAYDWSDYAGIDPQYRTGDPSRYGLTQIRRKGLRDGGASLRPDDADRLSVGAETLHLRIERASSSALNLARWLESRPEVKAVRYPGLSSHPQHERATRIFGHLYGQMLSFTFQDGIDLASRLDRLRLAILSTHLWDSRTLVIPVAPTIYNELGEEGRRAAGIDEGLIRISVGIERADDILADFAQAFDGAAAAN